MVKVDSTRPVKTISSKRIPAKKVSSSSSFSISEAPSTGSPSQADSPASLPNIKPIESLLCVQDINQKLNPEQKSYQRGALLLGHLEDLKLSLLEGTLSREKFMRLKSVINERHNPSNNPELEKIRHLIEQRVNIEIAKFEK